MAKVLNVAKLSKRFSALTKSRDSVQGLSSWILGHYESSQEILEEWLISLSKDSNLTAKFFVISDILLNCEKKSVPEFKKVIADSLEKAFSLEIVKNSKNDMYRLLRIWQKKEIYTEEYIQLLRDILDHEETTVVPADQKDTQSAEEQGPSEYKVENLIDRLKKLDAFRPNIETKRELLELEFRPELPDELVGLTSRSYKDLLKRFTKYQAVVNDYHKVKDEDINLRKMVIQELNSAARFFANQEEEFTQVYNAFAKYGKRLKFVEKKLSEKMKSFSPNPSSFTPGIRNSPVTEAIKNIVLSYKRSDSQDNSAHETPVEIKQEIIKIEEPDETENVAPAKRKKTQDKTRKSPKKQRTTPSKGDNNSGKTTAKQDAGALNQMIPADQKVQIELGPVYLISLSTAGDSGVTNPPTFNWACLGPGGGIPGIVDQTATSATTTAINSDGKPVSEFPPQTEPSSNNAPSSGDPSLPTAQPNIAGLPFSGDALSGLLTGITTDVLKSILGGSAINTQSKDSSSGSPAAEVSADRELVLPDTTSLSEASAETDVISEIRVEESPQESDTSSKVEKDNQDSNLVSSQPHDKTRDDLPPTTDPPEPLKNDTCNIQTSEANSEHEVDSPCPMNIKESKDTPKKSDVMDTLYDALFGLSQAIPLSLTKGFSSSDDLTQSLTLETLLRLYNGLHRIDSKLDCKHPVDLPQTAASCNVSVSVQNETEAFVPKTVTANDNLNVMDMECDSDGE